MTNSAISQTILCGSLIAESLVLFFLVKKKLIQRWLPLAIFEAFQLFESAVLQILLHFHLRKAYAYVYWAAADCSYLIEFWLLLWIAYSLFSWIKSHTIVVSILAVFVSISTFCGIYLSLCGPNIYRNVAHGALLTADKAWMASWCLLFILVAFSSSAIGIRWLSIESQIICSFTIQNCSELIWAAVVAMYGHKVWQYASTLCDCIYLGSALYLASALFRFHALQTPISLTSEMEECIAQNAQILEEIKGGR